MIREVSRQSLDGVRFGRMHGRVVSREECIACPGLRIQPQSRKARTELRCRPYPSSRRWRLGLVRPARGARVTNTTHEAVPEPRLSAREKALIAVGASIASGCRPCLERTIELARQSGACERSIRLAVETALGAHGRLLASLAECADRLQPGHPGLDDAFLRDRTRLSELIRCASRLPLRDAEGLDMALASAQDAGSTGSMIASVLAIARSIAKTATGIAECRHRSGGSTLRDRTPRSLPSATAPRRGVLPCLSTSLLLPVAGWWWGGGLRGGVLATWATPTSSFPQRPPATRTMAPVV